MSTPSTFPLFGRRYLVEIEMTDGSALTVSSDSFEPEALRVEFECELTALADRWLCTCEITNLNFATTGTIVKQGATLTISAGYQSGQNYGLVWTGKILWAEWTKRNVVDTVLTLQCVIGMDKLVNNLVNMATGPFQTQSQIVLAMAQRASTPFTIVDPGNVLDAATTGQLPRPVVMFGQPRDYLERAARQANTYFFPDFSGNVNILNLKQPNGTPTVIYSTPIPIGSTLQPDPSITYSIVGTPKQVLVSDALYGVSFRVLMDSRVQIKNPPMIVKIDASVLIDQAPQSFGAPPPVLSQTGTYAVISVTHIGDTRGQAWYTEIVAVNLIGDQLGLPSTNGKDNRYISVGNLDDGPANTAAIKAALGE
jgi:hypothetical protein